MSSIKSGKDEISKKFHPSSSSGEECNSSRETLTEKSGKSQVQGDQEVDDQAFDLDNLSEEDKAKWFRVEIINGHEVLKVKREMFTESIVKGAPIFLVKRTTYKKPEQGSFAIVFENDF